MIRVVYHSFQIFVREKDFGIRRYPHEAKRRRTGFREHQEQRMFKIINVIRVDIGLDGAVVREKIKKMHIWWMKLGVPIINIK